MQTQDNFDMPEPSPGTAATIATHMPEKAKDFLQYGSGISSGAVEGYMTRDVVSFGKNDSLFDICECLISNNFRRVTILDGATLVGIISRADIIPIELILALYCYSRGSGNP